MHLPTTSDQKKRIVIIGSGFAGLSAARALRRADVEVVLIDRRNHHLFQPLLYQVATAALSPAQIAQPIRSVMRGQDNCTVVLGEVTGVDTVNKCVVGKRGTLEYDTLIIATGSTHTYFGNDQWEEFAPGLKSIEDATLLRQGILSAFEQAEMASSEEERRACLTFVVVGAGPTGVEMAGAIAELARHTLRDNFRRINPADAHIILAEGGARILSSFPPALSARSQLDLKKMGVDVRTNSIIRECTNDGVQLGDVWVPARTIVWAAGVKASPAAQWLSVDADRAGRVPVQPDLSVKGHPNIFVIGDTAAVEQADGTFAPGLAPAAVQQGQYVAKLIMNRISGTVSDEKPFTYKNYGSMATIGRGKAIADLGWFNCAGHLAWGLWACIHLMPLIGFRNRFVVGFDWLWSYFTHERGVRLITLSDRSKGDF